MDRLAELILEQIEAVIERDPSEDALFDLLRIASPKISRESLTDEKLYKKLILQVDVNKKSSLYERADKVVKTLDAFYKDCLKESSSSKSLKNKNFLPPKKKGKNPTKILIKNTWKQQLRFSASMQEEQSCTVENHLLPTKLKEIDREKSVREIFEKNGGYRTLTSIGSIKEELMERGPVVSTSFKLTSAFLNAVSCRKKVFETNLENSRHPVLIVGWESTAAGEVWKICSTIRRDHTEPETHHVAFRQWGVDEECVVPKQSFETWTWQEGPYFDIDINMDYSQWCKNSQTMSFKVSSEELCTLSTTVGGDLITASTSRKKFTLRNARKLAQSRSCILTKAEFQAGEEWKISVKFDNESVLYLSVDTYGFEYVGGDYYDHAYSSAFDGYGSFQNEI
ncbi:predicted protein [Chaetoceros tenuissimus]|uniref:Uncharacterized protein n=1 Tax=Chaetoceros tenuissimus TaxID=426638 RepID=A0AAD3CSJ2_9STRA|nr:predicted protein [Chaetoceros tenuissimus]